MHLLEITKVSKLLEIMRGFKTVGNNGVSKLLGITGGLKPPKWLGVIKVS